MAAGNKKFSTCRLFTQLNANPLNACYCDSVLLLLSVYDGVHADAQGSVCGYVFRGKEWLVYL